ncbi:MAG TPA: hypothetical protein VF229_03455 [Burkholderiaceae bacterium]
MTTLHPSHHSIEVAEKIAATGLATAVAVLAVITAATLIYAWFIA